MKKAVLIFLVCLQILCFGIVIYAADIGIAPSNEFYSYDSNPQKVAEILDFTEAQLTEYYENNSLKFLAVNQSNTKQIKLDLAENDFSRFIGNISTLPDGDILGLADELSGIKNAGGSIATLGGQKFLKLEFKTSDSGGEYILTQYITVADSKSYRLSFYTDYGEDTSYIETTFNSLQSDDFMPEATPHKATDYIIPIACIAFLIVTVLIAISIISDIKKNRED